MTKPAALQADFTSYRPVPSRKVLQLVFEVPLETQEQTFKTLGYPTPGESTWVAVARLQEVAPSGAEDARQKKAFRDMPRSQQAALKLKDPEFRGWLRARFFSAWLKIEKTGEHENQEAVADAILKSALAISTKTTLDNAESAGKRWDALLTDYETRSYR